MQSRACVQRKSKNNRLFKTVMNNGLFREKTINRLFDAALILFLIASIFELTAWYALDNGGILYKGMLVIKLMAAVLCAVVILIKLLHSLYGWRMIVLYACMALVIGLSMFYSQSKYLLLYGVLFMSAYGQDSKRVISISAVVTAIMILMPILCGYLGLAMNENLGNEERVRFCLGFSWVTSAPMLFLFFSLQYIYLRKESMRKWEFLLLEGINIFFFFMTDSQMIFFLLTSILLFFFFESLLKKRFVVLDKLKWLWVVFPFLVFGFVMLIHLFYDQSNATWWELNDFIHGRLDLATSALNTYKITPFGQKIEWLGFHVNNLYAAGYNYVDCSYIQILLSNGLVYLFFVLFVYSVGIYRATRCKDYYLMCALVAILLLSITEPRLMNLSFNIFPILTFCKLNRESMSFGKCDAYPDRM